MKHVPLVFVSYEPNSTVERARALNLQTISSRRNFNIVLPERSMSSDVVSAETRERIHTADFYVIFSSTLPSATVQKEINVAFAKHGDKTKILVLYDKGRSGYMTGAENCTEFYVDTNDNLLDIIHDIILDLQHVGNCIRASSMYNLVGVLLIGIGLLSLTNGLCYEVFRGNN